MEDNKNNPSLDRACSIDWIYCGVEMGKLKLYGGIMIYFILIFLLGSFLWTILFSEEIIQLKLMAVISYTLFCMGCGMAILVDFKNE